MNVSIIEYEDSYFCSLKTILKDVYNSNITQDVIKNHYIDENKKIFLVKAEETIAGCAFLEIKTDYIRPNKYGFLTYVAIKESYRKLGLGRQLINYALDSAKDNGCTSVELTSANTRIGAHTFYESLGFTKKGTTVFIKEPI